MPTEGWDSEAVGSRQPLFEFEPALCMALRILGTHLSKNAVLK